ncbi:dopamine receptor 2-like [Diorhabda carinulata]|uniref:dopamine receptor 2-like n=1 Tax=Diorhabda carinulata TaxID=1163345 RepID=UPI0025A0DF2B|nr:dopamine receptor 2-like [Diorhabda carinulata]
MNNSDYYPWVLQNSSYYNLDNWTGNYSSEYSDAWKKWTKLMQDRVVVVSLLLIFSMCTVFGNMLVILAVIRERYLHTPTNYFITSLAVADCLVGLVVMPFSALYEVLGHTWFFGSDWCDIWRSLDVLFSTASILNLCVISLDRYWAINDPITYPMRMTKLRSMFLIAAVWVCSSAISFPAIGWWRAVRNAPIPAFSCPFTENLGYLIFSSTISFYLPLFVMVFTYFRIYRAAVYQTKSLRLGTKHILMGTGTGELGLTLRIHRGGTCKVPESKLYSTQEDEPLTALQNNGLSRVPSSRLNHHSKNFSLSRKFSKFSKEKKAAKTLGIVMGVFVICWLPFFVVNLLSGFCKQCISNERVVFAVVTWLGWINSSMNPVIYACWSRDFRRAFLEILCVCCPLSVQMKYQPHLRSKPSQVSQTMYMKEFDQKGADKINGDELESCSNINITDFCIEIT